MNNSDSETENDVRNITRKRNIHMDKWKSVVRKKKKDSGDAYILSVQDASVSKKVIGKLCKCKNKCFDRVGRDFIKIILITIGIWVHMISKMPTWYLVLSLRL